MCINDVKIKFDPKIVFPAIFSTILFGQLHAQCHIAVCIGVCEIYENFINLDEIP